jgi:fermentation-respiration switch protein FrsA (DUF1100 family)
MKASHDASRISIHQVGGALLLFGLIWPFAPVLAQTGPDPASDPCVLPAPAAEPGTQTWTQRDLQNMRCAEARIEEVPLSWVLGLGTAEMPSPVRDPYRAPARHDGTRFRFATAVVSNRSGEDLPAEIYRPCSSTGCSDVPPGLTVADGPYPAVLIVHGGGSQKELHRWAAQGLAEAGYLAISFDVASGNHGTDAQDMVDWLFSGDFPFLVDLDRDRVGIVGHSQGASTASLLGQLDPRLKAIVAWDNLTAVDSALWADDIGVAPPAGLPITTPALGIGADYYFTPRLYLEAPEPAPSNGEGGRGRGVSAHPKDLGYQELRSAGVDTMLFILRAGTHLDFTPLQAGTGSRYGEPVSFYLTLAWFDRYLKGLSDPAAAQAGHARLLAGVYDDSADIHAIGAGYYDPMTGNQPYRIADLSACDRMSFYFKSRYALRAPGSNQLSTSEDWKQDCLTGVAEPERISGGAAGFGLLLICLLGVILRRQLRPAA